MQQAFDQFMDDFFADDENDVPPHIAVAVSGGGDSMALLYLAQQYVLERGGELLALTVDHALRPDSGLEAKQVATWCAAHKITHETLLWRGDKPQTGIQDAARMARRTLLTDACRAQGIDVLLLGHHADDQAETVLMRLARGTGLRGLLGMRSITMAHDVTLVRPLLGYRRAALRDFCTKYNLPVIDDPSNDNAAFERVRVRRLLADWPELAHGVTQTLARLHDTDETLDMLASEWLEENIEPISDDTLWLADEFMTALYPPVQQRIVAGAVLESSPDAHDMADIPLDGLERLLTAMTKTGFAGQTLAGVHIKPHKADEVNGFLFSPAPKRRG